jgi:hypothetical protein
VLMIISVFLWTVPASVALDERLSRQTPSLMTGTPAQLFGTPDLGGSTPGPAGGARTVQAIPVAIAQGFDGLLICP